jgi:phytoene dehydrogenase-like protein
LADGGCRFSPDRSAQTVQLTSRNSHPAVPPCHKLRETSDYDVIIIGAGHNGLTAAVVLQRAGLRTLCLEANNYSGGMSATVELIDGFRHEIAGSVRFPTALKINAELGLDTLPTIEADIMSVNLGEHGAEAMVFHSDPMKMMAHLNEKHGMESVLGMAGLYGWASGPAKALGRFDVLAPPKTIDQMYACAADENERRAIHEMLFGSAMDVVDRFLPDADKHSVIRGMLAFLAVNSTYRGPYTPGSATCLAFALAMPAEGGQMTTKLKGGIGVLTEHLRGLFLDAAGEIRHRARVEKILVQNDEVTGVRLRGGSEVTAPVVVSNLAPESTLLELVGTEYLPSSLVTRLQGRDHRATFVQMHVALDGLPEYAAPYDYLNEPGMQLSVGCSARPNSSNGNGKPVARDQYRTIQRYRSKFRPSEIRTWRRPVNTPRASTPTPSRPKHLGNDTAT